VVLTLHLQYLFLNKAPAHSTLCLKCWMLFQPGEKNDTAASFTSTTAGCKSYSDDQLLKKPQVIWEDTAATLPVANIPSGTPIDAFISFLPFDKADV